MTEPSAEATETNLSGLVLVPTPIGNLRDMTFRAVDVLRGFDRIVAEDTRRTRVLLSHFGIEVSKLSRLDAHATDRDLARVVEWLQAGKNVALVTDAGMPGVSDPGSQLVKQAVAAGVSVTALPGASAVTTALAGSGFADAGFAFLGFFPRKQLDQAQLIERVAELPLPCVLFESPHRMTETVSLLAQVMPGRPIAVARELTKLHEEWIRTSVGELAATPRDWLGEITFVLGPSTSQTQNQPTDDEIAARIRQELADGVHTRTVASRITAWSGRSKREIYDWVLRLRDET